MNIHKALVVLLIDIILITACNQTTAIDLTSTSVVTTSSTLYDKNTTPNSTPIYSCANLHNDLLSELNIDWSMSLMDFKTWVIHQEAFRYFNTQLISATATVGDYFLWENAEYWYGAFSASNKIHSIEIQWKYGKEKANVSLVLECMGPPDYYEAYNTARSQDIPGSFTLGLWYTSLGVIIYFYSEPKLARDVKPILMASRALVCHPNPPESIIGDCYRTGIQQSQDYYRHKDYLRLWPGELTKILVDGESIVNSK